MPRAGDGFHRTCRRDRRADRVDDLDPGDAGERPAAERLARDEEVGLDAVVLDRPNRASPDAALHLVVDVEDPVAVAELAQPREVGGMDEPALSWTGSSTTQATASGSTSDLKSASSPWIVVGRDAAVRVWAGAGRPPGTARSRQVHDLAGHRHGGRVRPWKRPVEDDDRLTARRHARDLDRSSRPPRRPSSRQALLLAAAHDESSASRRQTSTYGSYIPTMKHWWR